MLHTGEYELAKERFELALKANRTNHFAYQYLGFVAVTQDSGAEAVRNFELARKFAEAKPLQALACTHLARAYYASGDRDRAVALAAEAVQLQPDSAAFYYRHAQYCALAEKGREALTALSKAWGLDMAYWPMASVDKDFDGMRQEVQRVQEESRFAFRAAAQRALNALERIVDNARLIRLGSLSTHEGVCERLKAQTQEDNVFVLLETCKEADDVAVQLATEAEKHLVNQAHDKRGEICQLRQRDQEQIIRSQSSLRETEAKLRELDDQGMKRTLKNSIDRVGWLGTIILFCVSASYAAL